MTMLGLTRSSDMSRRIADIGRRTGQDRDGNWVLILVRREISRAVPACAIL